MYVVTKVIDCIYPLIGKELNVEAVDSYINSEGRHWTVEIT